jgi:hypothetical protein
VLPDESDAPVGPLEDGKYLRDTGVKDGRGFRAHPAHQCAALTVGVWNQVTVPLGSLAGRKITSLLWVTTSPPRRAATAA